MAECSLKEYIRWSLRVLEDFKIFLQGEELKAFKALPTKDAVDRRRIKLIKASFDN